MGLGLLFYGGTAVIGMCSYFYHRRKKEEEYQRELRREHRRYRERIERTAEEYKNKAKEELRKEYKNVGVIEDNILKRAKEILIEEGTKHYNFLKEELEKREKNKINELEEIKVHIEDLKEIKKKMPHIFVVEVIISLK